MLAYHLLGDPHRTDDALQDTYVKVFRGLSGFSGDSALSTWLTRIAYTTCIDHLRRQRRVVPLPDLEPELGLPEGPDPTDDLSARSVVRDALRRLPPEQRAVVVLVGVQGLGYQQAADILEVPSGTVASRFSSARHTLRAALRGGDRLVGGRRLHGGGFAMTDDRWAPDDPCADENLWDLVAAIPVPAAADNFMARLSARLSAGPNDAAALCESRLAVLQGPPARTRRRHPVRLFIAAAIVAAAAAALAFAVLPALRGTDTATAADMLASMSRASSNVQTIRLRVVEHKTIADLILSTNGDYRASQATEGPAEPGTSPGRHSRPPRAVRL